MTDMRRPIRARLPGLGALAARLASERAGIALLLDYDGTLAEIRDRPADARPDPASLLALEELSAQIPVAIVSGRGIDDLRTLLDLPRATYFGSHGQQAQYPGGKLIEPFGTPGAGLREVRGRVDSVAREFDGTWVERKPQAVVLHYRRLSDPRRLPELRDQIKAVAKQNPDLRMMAGRKVYEFVPATAPGKGGAVNWYVDRLERQEGAARRPVYFGDDVSDEGAFEAVSGRGIGVLVARRARPTSARYRLGGVNQVAAALTLLNRLR